ncbi:MAG: MBL fold metallo-hydrolase [bacterium]
MKRIERDKFIDIGKIRVYFIQDKSFSVDGSLIYTPLSKDEWSKFAKDVGNGKVEVKTRSLLIETGRHRILVDCGLGLICNKIGIKATGGTDLKEEIKGVGFKLSDIDIVIITHLHFDHAGYILNENGVPLFEDATYYIQKQEFDDAINNNEITVKSYINESFKGLMRSKQLKLINGDYMASFGVRLWLSGGHTSGHQMVLVKSRGDGLLFCGDIIPTKHHIKLDMYSAYDLFPLSVLSMKKRIIKLVRKHNWYIAFSHDPDKHFIKL